MAQRSFGKMHWRTIRVERFASEQLGTVHVDPTKENIVVTKIIKASMKFSRSAKARQRKSAAKPKPGKQDCGVGVLRCFAVVLSIVFSGVINTSCLFTDY